MLNKCQVAVTLLKKKDMNMHGITVTVIKGGHRLCTIQAFLTAPHFYQIFIGQNSFLLSSPSPLLLQDYHLQTVKELVCSLLPSSEPPLRPVPSCTRTIESQRNEDLVAVMGRALCLPIG